MACCIRDSSSTKVDLDLFTGKVRFGCLYIRMGKLLESHLMGKDCNREKDVWNNVIYMNIGIKQGQTTPGVIYFLKNINL